MAEPWYVDAGARFDEQRRYRYSLWRVWDPGRRRVGFVMLNPSTADEHTLDPTLRRCLGYAAAWGFGGFIIANLFAWRATDPRELAAVEDPVGPENDEALRKVTRETDLVVCAWGNGGNMRGRRAAALQILLESRSHLHVLRLSKIGEPCHPLYLPASLTPVEWTPELGRMPSHPEQGIFSPEQLRPVHEVGPCPTCGEKTVRNDRGGTTCVSCAMTPSTEVSR